MPERRRKFTPEFKDEAVKMVLDADERRELERLRGELVALRAALAPRRPRLAEVATGALIGEPPRFRIPDPIRSGPERRMINARTAQKVHA